MSLKSCPFCEQLNPADAKFCNACGGALHLVPCPHCGAVSDVTATTCYQCHAQLPGRNAQALDVALPAADASKPSLSRNAMVSLVLAGLAVIATLGYYGFLQPSHVDAPQAPTASGEARGRSTPAAADVVGRDATAGEAASARTDPSAQPASPATSPRGTPLAGQSPAAANGQRANRPPVELRRGKAASGPIGRPRATDADNRGTQIPPRQEVCTEAVAALGLCTMSPDQKREAEATSVNAAISRPEASDAGEAGGQEPAGEEACTEAVAALGLCTPASTQRRQ